MQSTFHRTLGLALGLLAASACGDDTSGSPRDDAGIVGDGDGDGTCEGEGSDDGDAGTGGLGSLGPTARVRVANTVPGSSFDAWAANTSRCPVRVAQSIPFGAISDYFEVPVNAFSQDPEFVLLPSGERPADTNWLVVSGPDRAFITTSQLDGAGQQGSLIVSLDDDTNQLQYEQLDESDLNAGDASQANLHIAYGLFDIAGGQNIDLGTVGKGCFHSGSTSVSQVFSLPAGNFEFGVYDSQVTAGCAASTLLASAPLDVAAGENVLLVTYLDDNAVKIVSAPILRAHAQERASTEAP